MGNSSLPGRWCGAFPYHQRGRDLFGDRVLPVQHPQQNFDGRRSELDEVLSDGCQGGDEKACAGANWWQTNGDAWSVGIDGSESIATADFWQDLVDRDLVKVEPLLTPEWNAQVNAGKILSWAAAAWAPSVIYAVAPDTAGQWQSAPLPQWTAGNSAVPFLGGSAYLVPEKSQHAQAAVEFASWLAASKEGSELLLGLDIYPASNAGQEATLNHATPQLMPEQTDFYRIADQVITDTTIPVTWGPNVNVAQSAFGDALSAAALNKSSFSDVYTQLGGGPLDFFADPQLCLSLANIAPGPASAST